MIQWFGPAVWGVKILSDDKAQLALRTVHPFCKIEEETLANKK
jgi:hypothetical protein